MSGPLDENELSTVEELDPERASTGRVVRARELILGVVLIVAVLGWAGWQWVRQDALEKNYRAAGQAVAVQDWDSALAHYSAATGYKDADSQAGKVTAKIAERRTYYDEGIKDVQASKWAEALKALQTVDTIQPGYNDTEKRIDQAREHVYQEALRGAVALRIHAQPPGLYYRSAAGWVYLKGSDIYSEMRGWGNPDEVIYDTPGEGWTPAAPDAPSPGDNMNGPARKLKGRGLSVALFGSGGSLPRFVKLALNPQSYDFYLCSKGGVWAVSYGQTAAMDADNIPVRVTLTEDLLTYESLVTPPSGPVTATVILPGPNWKLLDADAGGDKLLMADWDTASIEVSGENNPLVQAKIRLWIASGDGGTRKLIYSYYGGLNLAQFSPDGSYVGLSTYTAVGAPGDSRYGEEDAVILLGITDKLTSTVLERESVLNSLSQSDDPWKLSLTFVKEGALAGRLLVGYRDVDLAQLALYDPKNPDNGPIRAVIPATVADQYRLWVTEQEGAQGVLVTGGGVSPGSTGTDTFSEALLSDKQAAQVGQIDYGAKSITAGSLIGPLHAGDRLALGADVFYRDNEGVLNELTSLVSTDVASLGESSVTPTLVYSASLHSGLVPSTVARHYYLGADLFTYLLNGELHARTYDGVTDVLLERDVTKLFDPKELSGRNYLR